MRALALLLLSVAVLGAQTNPVRPVQHTNGRVVSPTNFWTANSNAINAVVTGGGGSSFDQDLNTTDDVTFRTLSLPVDTATPQIVLPEMGGNITPGLWPSNQIGLFSKSGRLRLFDGTATNRIFAFLDETTNAANLTTGTVADARLSANVVVRSNGTATASRFVATEQMGTSSAVNYAMGGDPTTGLGGTSLGNNIVAKIQDTTVWDARTNGLQLFTPLQLDAHRGSAAAWLLSTAPTNGLPTIATNEHGVGWDDLGRFSVNTPVGSLSMYETGSPSTPTIFWPGTIVANRFSAVYFDSIVYASNIVGGSAGGAIADSVMRESMPTVLRNFMGGDGAAGAAGVPYILTNASMQPVPGNYVPYGTVVTNGSGTLELTGRWWDMNAFLTNLITNGIPTGSAPANAFVVADGASRSTTRTNLPSLRIDSGVITNSGNGLTITQTWSNAAVAFNPVTVNVNNVTSSNTSTLMRLQTGGTNRFTVNAAGGITAASLNTGSVSIGSAQITFLSAIDSGRVALHSQGWAMDPGLVLVSNSAITWTASSSIFGSNDTTIYRDAAGSVGQRNGTNSQTNSIYGLFTNSTNFRRLSLGMSNSGIAFIRPEQAGPATNGTNLIYISGLPTTNTGLPSGVLWVSNGVVAVTP